MACFAARPLRGSATKSRSARIDREIALAQPHELRVAERAEVLAHYGCGACARARVLSHAWQFQFQFSLENPFETSTASAFSIYGWPLE